MDIKNLTEAVYKTFQSLIDGWLVKSAVSILVGISASPQMSVLTAFITLIGIDLITKWLAVSWKYLEEKKKIPKEKIGLFMCFLNMWKAFKAGYINSDAMKHRFCGKILLYLIVTIAAAKADIMIAGAGEGKMFLNSAWVFLALTEASSILENLRDAGVRQAGDLLSFMQGRLGVLLERYKLK